ncbi:MAG: chloride channel protein [Lautropia sp.]|nr:chloride channel protein [Lautropia sp.]
MCTSDAFFKRHIRLRLALAVLLTGIAAGLGAAALSWLIHVVEQLAFGHSEARVQIITDGTSPERRLLAVMGGGIIVSICWAWLQMKGRPVVSVAAAVAADTPVRLSPPLLENLCHAILQIVAVGSGAPIGREVAPRELGALFAGRIAAWFRLDASTHRLLVASGAAAGLAGVYQVPLAGTLFTLEILIAQFSLRNGIVAMSVSIVATLVARLSVSTHTFYVVGQLGGSSHDVLWAAMIGACVGLPGLAFRQAVKQMESRRAHGWTVLWALPMACLATALIAIWLPQILGNGRSAAQTAYDGTTLALCSALLVGKTVSVLITLRAGAFGGTLTPGLSIGALLGLFLALLIRLVPESGLPGTGGALASIDLAAAALAGSAGFLAVSMNAPLTAFALVMGFTGEHSQAILPLMSAVMMAMATAACWPAGHHSTQA